MHIADWTLPLPMSGLPPATAVLLKKLSNFLKFKRAKAAGGVIARHMDNRLPYLPPQVIVSPVPTANGRVRMRGYDQSVLIARQFAHKRGLVYRQTLRRVSATRQVGANRRERFRHLENAFEVRKSATLAGKQILLIDDVLTTGATLEAAAKTLAAHKVARIDAAVFAH